MTRRTKEPGGTRSEQGTPEERGVDEEPRRDEEWTRNPGQTQGVESVQIFHSFIFTFLSFLFLGLRLWIQSEEGICKGSY